MLTLTWISYLILHEGLILDWCYLSFVSSLAHYNERESKSTMRKDNLELPQEVFLHPHQDYKIAFLIHIRDGRQHYLISSKCLINFISINHVFFLQQDWDPLDLILISNWKSTFNRTNSKANLMWFMTYQFFPPTKSDTQEL